MSILDEPYVGDYVVPAWKHMPDLPEVQGRIRKITYDGRVRVFQIDWEGDLPKEFTDYVTIGKFRIVRRGHTVSQITREQGDDEIYAAYLKDFCGGNAPEEPAWDSYGMDNLGWVTHWGFYSAYLAGFKRARIEGANA